MTSEPSMKRSNSTSSRRSPQRTAHRSGAPKTPPRTAGGNGGGGRWSGLGGEELRKRVLGLSLRVGKWVLLLAFLGAIVGVGTLAALFAVYGADADLPEINKLKTYRSKQVTRVLAADGKTLLGEIYDERRSYVSYDRIPKVLVQAVVAAEDAAAGLAAPGGEEAVTGPTRPRQWLPSQARVAPWSSSSNGSQRSRRS